MPIPRSRVEITSHAHVRGWERLELSLQERKEVLRRIVARDGQWYAHPEARDQYLVLGRLSTRPPTSLCVMTLVEDGTVRVNTVWELTNPGQLAKYKAHNRQGPLSPDDIRAYYDLG